MSKLAALKLDRTLATVADAVEVAADSETEDGMEVEDVAATTGQTLEAVRLAVATSMVAAAAAVHHRR